MLGLLQQEVKEKVLCMYSINKFNFFNLETFIPKFRINVSKVKVFKCFYFVNMLGLLQQQVVEQNVLYVYSVYIFKIFNLDTCFLKFRINVYSINWKKFCQISSKFKKLELLPLLSMQVFKDFKVFKTFYID